MKIIWKIRIYKKYINRPFQFILSPPTQLLFQLSLILEKNISNKNYIILRK